MLKNNHKKIYKISADILPVDIEIIKVYMQGAVYAFCNIKKDEPFSARILFGGNNKNWQGTPMQKLYDYYTNEGKAAEDAYKSASIDAGRLLKSVLDRDKYRTFEIVGKDTGTLYKVVK